MTKTLQFLSCTLLLGSLSACTSENAPSSSSVAGNGGLNGTGGTTTGGGGTGVGATGGTGGSVCAMGFNACSTGCVDTLSDGAHCGACESPCEGGLSCSLGSCADQCADGLSQCSSSCVDVLTSVTHCGGCDVACAPGDTCEGGFCVTPEPEPEPPVGCESVTDACPFGGGLTHQCVTRFSLGINYAWRDFAADFGGLAAWGAEGVTGDSASYAADLADMSNKGAQTVRWWMFPDFRGDGVQFDGAGDPSGLSSTALSDIATALDLAEAQDVYLVLTLFSFDNFRPTRDEGGITVRGMSPMVRDSGRRAKLIDNVVKPAADAVAASPNKHRLLGWDIINEPEWAVSPTGSAPSGGEFTPNDELDDISLSEMKALINEATSALKAMTPEAQVSVGWAAAKWAWAFSDVTSVDFHQPHIYAWVNEYWPYSSSPADLGYSGKPTVMGEFYLQSFPFGSGPSFEQIVSSWFDNGYAGAWSWQYNENAGDLGLNESFAAEKGCSVRF